MKESPGILLFLLKYHRQMYALIFRDGKKYVIP